MNIRTFVRSTIDIALENRKYRLSKTAKQYNNYHNSPILSLTDKKEIDQYWAKFNIKFENYEWHRMYYAVTGLHDPRFIPEPIAERVLYRFYNKQEFIPAYADKNMFYEFLPQMNFPVLIGKRVNSHYFDAKGTYYGETISDQLIDALYSDFEKKDKDTVREIIIKESLGSSQGKGVQKIRVDKREDIKSCLFENQSKNFVLQIAVQQHNFFEQFNKDSVNIVRITTWRKGNSVHILSPCIRIGIKGSHTDVSFVNGTEIVNAIKIEGGKIANHYVTLEGKYYPLPDLYIKQVPHWEDMVNCVKENALKLSYFDIVGWDITLDKNNQVICIEYNIKWPGTVVYQFAHGPLAGDKTDELLSFLQDENNVKWIPKCIRKENK